MNRPAAEPSRPSFLYWAVTKGDQVISRWQTRLFERPGSLIVLFLHGLFRDDEELQSGAAYPQQETTLHVFDEMIAFFREAGYRFISPTELLGQLDFNKRFALLTFDDGYFNNTRAVSILEKHNAPATVFVSVRHTLEQKAYWWEGLYHARRAQGVPLEKICEEASRLNTFPTALVEQKLTKELGASVLQIRGDTDRPITPDELRKFSSHPLISVGNHTYDHNVLTAYSTEEGRESIRKAQDALKDITGRAPLAIAYPNGQFTQNITRIAAEEGLELGFTAVPCKEYLPAVLQPQRRMAIGRFRPNPAEDFRAQYEYFRSDLMLSNRLRHLRRRHSCS